MHVAGYTRGLNFADVLVPAWAAGFSAFGCACADFEYRLDRTLNIATASPELAPAAFAAGIEGIAAVVNAGWTGLRTKVADEFAKSRVPTERIVYRHCLRVQYVGQLNDLEVELPFDTIRTADDVRAIVDRFEEAYAKLSPAPRARRSSAT
jgi:N-methylhydantoinase A/oxoprolinase/acetone carboxylase beta subunit